MTADDRPNARYPLRPDHPDFRRLAEICRELDAEAEQPHVKSVADLVGLEVDIASVTYAALQRAMRIKESTGTDLGLVHLGAAWMEGMLVGIRFEQRGRQ